jgi:hypothetical protein
MFAHNSLDPNGASPGTDRWPLSINDRATPRIWELHLAGGASFSSWNLRECRFSPFFTATAACTQGRQIAAGFRPGVIVLAVTIVPTDGIADDMAQSVSSGLFA